MQQQILCMGCKDCCAREPGEALVPVWNANTLPGDCSPAPAPEAPLLSVGRGWSGTLEPGPVGTPSEGRQRPGCSTLQLARKKPWASRQVPGPLPLCNLLTAAIKHPPSPDPSDSPACPFFPQSEQGSLSSGHTSRGGLGAPLGSTAREGAGDRLCFHLRSSQSCTRDGTPGARCCGRGSSAQV